MNAEEALKQGLKSALTDVMLAEDAGKVKSLLIIYVDEINVIRRLAAITQDQLGNLNLGIDLAKLDLTTLAASTTIPIKTEERNNQ